MDWLTILDNYGLPLAAVVALVFALIWAMRWNRTLVDARLSDAKDYARSLEAMNAEQVKANQQLTEAIRDLSRDIR